MKHLADNNFNSNKLENVPTPIEDGSAANKEYVDTSLNGKVSKNELVFNITDFGAVGDDSTDNTTAIQTCINAALAVRGVIYIPPGIFQTNPLDFSTDKFTIRGAGKQSVLKLKSQNLATRGNHALLQVFNNANAGGSGSYSPTGTIYYDIILENFSADGNKANHTNKGSLTYNMDVVNFKYVHRSVIRNLTVFNSLTDGIDFDEAKNCVITGNISYNNDGCGIHVSGTGDTENNIFSFNELYGNGTAWTRAGIDQNPSAFDNVYVGNDSHDNYRNYSMEGTGALFESNKSHNGANPDIHTGVTITRINTRRKKANGGTNSVDVMGDVMMLPIWGQTTGNSTPDVTVAVTWPVTFDEVIAVQASMLGRNQTTAAASIYGIDLSSGNPITIQATNITNSGCNVRIIVTGGNLAASSYYSYCVVVWGRRAQ